MENLMATRKTIDELCNALGVFVSFSSDSWYDRSQDLTITIPTHPGIDYGMSAEEYVYAALTGIYAYQKNKIKTRTDIILKEPIVPSKQVSQLAKLLKRPTKKAKGSSV
jgi:hypothetical protein